MWARILKKTNSAIHLNSFFVKSISKDDDSKWKCIFENSLNINKNTKVLIDAIQFADELFKEIPESEIINQKLLSFKNGLTKKHFKYSLFQ